jgi:hypothetical protein
MSPGNLIQQKNNMNRTNTTLNLANTNAQTSKKLIIKNFRGKFLLK